MLSKQALARGVCASRSALARPSVFSMSELKTALSSVVSKRNLSATSAAPAMSSNSPVMEHRRRNSFSLSMRSSQNNQSKRRNSSSVPPASANKRAMPVYSVEQSRVPPGMNQEDVALDMFFSGYRPLFVLDHFNKKQPVKSNISDDHEYMPWDVSVSGLSTNPEMKNVPRKIVRNLIPYVEAPTENEANTIETLRQQRIEALKKQHQRAVEALGVADSENVKVISFEINNNEMSNSPVPSTEFSVFVDGELANNPDVVKSLKKVQEVLANPEEFTRVHTPYIIESPVSDSFGRIIYATSVKRKRKLKMNKHKLKKRRKLQRALRRKLNR